MRASLSRLLFAGWILIQSHGGGIASEPAHWAYQPLRPVTVPKVGEGTAVRNPVDAFIRVKLAASGFEPAKEADRRTLLRRVHFNLTGLPPTPDEMRAFLTDTSTNAYEKVVDRLLASPRHGERWARHWMDAAHFAETHGHDQDRMRTHAWRYRDYLIGAFNADKPYARFVEEQVAGDVLFPGEPQATVALGFIAAGPWDESSLRDIREDTLDRQIGRYLDRDDMVSTVMSVFASSTVHCARCHDHKFDPIPTADYYALQAVFAGVERANRVFDEEPETHVRRQELMRKRRRLERGDHTLLRSDATAGEVGAWCREQVDRTVTWSVFKPRTFLSAGGATLIRQGDDSHLVGGTRPERDTYTLTGAVPEGGITALLLEVLPDDALPQRGPGRADNGNLHLSEVELLLFEPGEAKARELKLTHPTADFSQDDWTIAHAIDGNEKTAWGIHPREGESHRAVFRLKEPLRATTGATLVVQLRQLHGGGHLIGRFRLSTTDAPGPVRILPADIGRIAAMSVEERSEEEQTRLATFVLREGINEGLAALPRPSLVYAAASDFDPDGSLRPSLMPRPVHVLRRGEITQPQEAVGPGALGCVEALAARFNIPEGSEEGARRAALARWLTDPDNPLTWRSIVNRAWQHHFGVGLVDTPNDFGRMGGTPSHPELLDWLAIWFRDEARGSLKQLHRLLVTSATYRQAAAGTTDADNRLLARMNRLRLDAECVRDAMLLVSGRLDLRMGGPGDLQFDLQPGIHVTPRVDYSRFDVDSAAGRRRSVYRFLFRTLPDPFMDALDCPAGDQLIGVRNNGVTVQQALALWNNAFVVRQAEHLAARLEAESIPVEARIQQAFELVLGRDATADELEDFVGHARKHGLANCCRLLFNSNEFVFVN
jgi:hypothetical protein